MNSTQEALTIIQQPLLLLSYTISSIPLLFCTILYITISLYHTKPNISKFQPILFHLTLFPTTVLSPRTLVLFPPINTWFNLKGLLQLLSLPGNLFSSSLEKVNFPSPMIPRSFIYTCQSIYRTGIMWCELPRRQAPFPNHLYIPYNRSMAKVCICSDAH